MTSKKPQEGRKIKIRKYKSLEHKINSLIRTKRIKQKKIYPKEQCHFIKSNGSRCTALAIGSGQLCKKHGGTLDRSSLVKEGSLEKSIPKPILLITLNCFE